MNINYKLAHPDAKKPYQATEGAVCVDLHAVAMIETDLYVEYDTGVIVDLPEDVACFLYARSSVSNKGLILANGVGVIDSDYRGTIKARFYKMSLDSTPYEVGDRVCQLEFRHKPFVQLTQVADPAPTDRNTGGFGSTGD
jgi:dUTP pyrophosphatase